MLSIEIITIGNEILMGDTIDSNSNYICKNLTQMGGYISRVIQIRDEYKTIIEEIQSSLSREPSFLFILGGLGPTIDDGTLAAVARSTNHPLTLDKRAYDFIKSKYEELAEKGYLANGSMTPAREKMAWIPTGSIPIENPVGTAPGIVLNLSSTIIINLPGVPSELKGIFELISESELKPKFTKSFFARQVLVADTNDETILAPIISDLSNLYPDVYIKSKPKGYGADVKIRIMITFIGDLKENTGNYLNEISDKLVSILANQNICATIVEE